MADERNLILSALMRRREQPDEKIQGRPDATPAGTRQGHMDYLRSIDPLAAPGYAPTRSAPEEELPPSIAESITGRMTPAINAYLSAISRTADDLARAGVPASRVLPGQIIASKIAIPFSAANSIVRALAFPVDRMTGRRNDLSEEDIINLMLAKKPAALEAVKREYD